MVAELGLEHRFKKPLFFAVYESVLSFDILYKLRSPSMTHLHTVYYPAIKGH